MNRLVVVVTVHRDGRAVFCPGEGRAGSAVEQIVEGGLLVGAQPLPVFRQVLDSILKAKGSR